MLNHTRYVINRSLLFTPCRYKTTLSLKSVQKEKAPTSKSIESEDKKKSNVKVIAVVLSGCGLYDGTSIHEFTAVEESISRLGGEMICYAPDEMQDHVFDHLKGVESLDNPRNILEESTRLNRGTQVIDIKSLHPNCADGLVIPGGFGVTKNLSDFEYKLADCKVHDEVVRALENFTCLERPIAFCGHAGILAAKVIKDVTITLGKDDGENWPNGQIIKAAESLGATCIPKDVNEFQFDEKNLIFTTPAFLYLGEFNEINEGISNMITTFMSVVKPPGKRNQRKK